MKKQLTYLLILISLHSFGQSSLEFNGMFQGFTTYTNDSELKLWSGGRYIPELKYEYKIDSLQSFSAYGSANLYADVQYAGGDPKTNAYINPYRAWVRYAYANSEIRVGLQKIDFGSASILRPLQWFNQIDPRDPLGLTNGVYSALGKYYFKNNANVWFWVLYGNEERRGFDVLPSDKKSPEYGGRLQLPTPKGEIAFSYHHRNAIYDNQDPVYPEYINTIENKYGIDGKWDVGVGLWFEGSYTKLQDPISIFTNQTLLNLGTDYTINGLNIVFEHLFLWYGEEWNKADYRGNTSAISFNYPISFFDNVSLMVYQDWTNNGTGAFASYNHDFNLWTGYFMLYYNPTTQITSPIVNNDLNQFTSGFGVRFMAIINH
ncbi:hypothetical protein [Flammeovirga sp. MY04]|uniref:hypothetical protein n=1 Tax=Flammeovirga sp. MY04 TaxID=1191459 RepID=UPI000824094D|nr:hypothetical protein [Flammeovirga sp. MY04]